jgi:glycosyltransferase involved in cell wall biosynthesis
MIASDNPGNVEGLTAFLDSAWPIIRRQRPNAELRIFGPLAEKAPACDGVVRVGYIRRLDRAYREAAVIVNPVRFGTGLKIKTVEALARGKAVVTTSCGAEGLESGMGSAFIVEDDMQRFGHATAALLADADARARLGLAAAVFAGAQFNRETAYAGLLEILASRLAQSQHHYLAMENGH